MSSCPSAASRLPICSRSLTAARLPLLQDEPLSSQLQPCRLVGGSGGQRRHSVTLACLRSVVRFGHAHVLSVAMTKRARVPPPGVRAQMNFFDLTRYCDALARPD